jgi:predicted transcriptional regulator
MAENALPLRLAWQIEVQDDPTLTTTDMALAFALLRSMDAKGSCYPGVELLARRMHSSRSTAMRARAELVAAGVLHVEQRSGHSNLYQALLRGVGHG